jgi:hypothetical protein
LWRAVSGVQTLINCSIPELRSHKLTILPAQTHQPTTSSPRRHRAPNSKAAPTSLNSWPSCSRWFASWIRRPIFLSRSMSLTLLDSTTQAAWIWNTARWDRCWSKRPSGGRGYSRLLRSRIGGFLGRSEGLDQRMWSCCLRLCTHSLKSGNGLMDVGSKQSDYL